MRFPGLIDVHVHLRTPGAEHKENFHSGSRAALAGGFTTLLAMPNTQPPLVSLDQWRIAQTRATTESLCDVFLYAGASAEHLAELPALAQAAPALKIYLDQTYGPLHVRGLEVLSQVFAGWNAPKPICLHAEGESVAMALGLCAAYGKQVHFCHISRRAELNLIARAKAAGLPVTCEVTPHHLFLNAADAGRLGPFADMRPTLASADDQQALWEQLNSTIDCIASDHAPHTRAEKQGANPPPGVPGLESTLPLMLSACARGRLSYTRLVDLLYTNPQRIFRLPEQPDTFVEVDEGSCYRFPAQPLQTRCGWSPFTGMDMVGRVERVVLRGKEVVKNGRVTVAEMPS